MAACNSRDAHVASSDHNHKYSSVSRNPRTSIMNARGLRAALNATQRLVIAGPLGAPGVVLPAWRFWPSVEIAVIVPPNPVVLFRIALLIARTVDPAAALTAVPLFERVEPRTFICAPEALAVTAVVELATRQSVTVTKPFVFASTPVVFPSMLQFFKFATANPAVVVTRTPVTCL
jgi:hypothetical protein